MPSRGRRLQLPSRDPVPRSPGANGIRFRRVAFDFLPDDAAIADDFLDVVLGLGILPRSELHCPEADAVAPVASAVAFDPLLDTGAIVRYGVIAHGFGIGEDQGESVGILLDELAQPESGGLEDYL